MPSLLASGVTANSSADQQYYVVDYIKLDGQRGRGLCTAGDVKSAVKIVWVIVCGWLLCRLRFHIDTAPFCG